MDRQDFMDIVYSELHSDGDNNRANRIIDAADEYAESAQLDTDCISRQAALDIFDDYNVAVENGQIEAYSRDRKRLCDLPSVTPKQRTGKWIKGHCSECGDHAPYWSMSSAYYGSKFCPNCGTKMEGDAE